MFRVKIDIACVRVSTREVRKNAIVFFDQIVWQLNGQLAEENNE